ncbi:MAG: ATP-binding cassette domain-containing protein [Akkermansiaceae bacterium]|nr:ATP-binding cassette domain-containing protein [Akkermansiaceae bacterium]
MSEFEIRPGRNLGIVGRNGSGKTTFAASLAGKHGGTLVSFELENELLEREIREDDSEFLDRIDFGRSVRELIEEVCSDGRKLEDVAEVLGLSKIIEQGFLTLSTGERRRLMLARALVQNPKLLVLDEPFDGLDQAFRQPLRDLLDGRDLILVANRLSDLEGLAGDVCCVEDGRVILSGSLEELVRNEAFQQLMGLGEIGLVLPDGKSIAPPPGALVSMEKVTVVHGGREIISDFDWTVESGQNWKISGPNGCGKSTLVNLVTGDHPQCYSNDVTVMGMRRGLGESIWDIKRYVGIVSPSLHQQHRVSFNALQIVASGFFDSVGIYQDVAPGHWKVARMWLELVGMAPWADRPFRSLSYGQQRLLLIARALVKRPPLLVLDEPCQGLDPINRALVLGVIDRIASTNLTQILYITHEPEDRLDCVTHELRYEGDGWLIEKLA